MRTYGGVDVWTHIFLTPALVGWTVWTIWKRENYLLYRDLNSDPSDCATEGHEYTRYM
jgi:hypothetical protein